MPVTVLQPRPIHGNKDAAAAPMTMFNHIKHLSLLVALGGLSGCLEPTDHIPDTSITSSSGATDTSDPTTTTTGDPPTSTTEGASSTTGTTMHVCGDGVRDDGEDCDDGPKNADNAACTASCAVNVCGDGLILADTEACDDGSKNADDAACTASCEVATCGDGKLLAGVEVCDDGVNDGAYGSCAGDCMAKASYCGDGILDDGNEECDSPDDPACLASCMLARSCLVIHESDASLQSGPRTIYPVDPMTPVEVYCDMDTDGGGYTFLKVDVDSANNDLPYPANKAEMICAQHGMQLFIPRSPEHLLAAYGVATVDNVAPVGGGDKGSSVDYLQILAIYPVTSGKSCLGKALNPEDCPQWSSSDGEAWFVSDVSKNNGEPDPDGACTGCSMTYTWNPDATLKNSKTIPGSGGSSLRFLCDVADKLP